MSAIPNSDPQTYDWDDPHHFHHDEEGHEHTQHHVSSWQLLVLILFALIFFTVLTVVVAQFEVFITEATGVKITQLWNVIIAMSIATVKAMLVTMYFMHLRHDNPLNSFVLLFTLVVMGLFLAFTSIDIASTGTVTREHYGSIVQGGTGVQLAVPSRSELEPGAAIDVTGPLAIFRRNEYIIKNAVKDAKTYAKSHPLSAEALAALGVEPETEIPQEPAEILQLADYAATAPISDQIKWLSSGNPWQQDFWTPQLNSYWLHFYEHHAHYSHHLSRHPDDPTDAYDRFLRSGGGHHADAQSAEGDAGHADHETERSTASQRVIRRGLHALADAPDDHHGESHDDSHANPTHDDNHQDH